ncbi:MAG: transglutaminase N-terminal domain-containing protein [Gammaproteobacteria bacterium]
MQRYKILHRTYYSFSDEVRLEPHALRLRPREGHELRIESSVLEITPQPLYDGTVTPKIIPLRLPPLIYQPVSLRSKAKQPYSNITKRPLILS